MNPLNILLIGLGNMGKIHKRVIENNSETNLYGIVDTSFEHEHEIINGVEYFNQLKLVNLDEGLIDGVVISSTTSTHYEVAKKFLERKIPVFLEKPISVDENEIEKLLNLASSKKSVFRCGLIEIYNPVFQHIKALNLKDIISVHIYRHSQSVAEQRKLENVLFDLTLHDISVLSYLFNSPTLKPGGQNLNFVNNSLESVDLLYSFEDTNVFISTSGVRVEDLDLLLNKFNLPKNLTLLHGFQSEPTQIKDNNLNRIKTLKSRYPELNIGFMDHSIGNNDNAFYLPLVALGLGVSCIEKHITLNKKMKGPDHFFAIEPSQFKKYVSNIHRAFLNLGSFKKEMLPDEKKYCELGYH